ncbi:hypothetical protein AURDEDRAFT_184153 [Auricularia subglabra TFB-10046 SS5]|nr:hypothetical protein AURDEDRAFT_184153 [Auricularia subglabra TFB-10046 SS5]
MSVPSPFCALPRTASDGDNNVAQPEAAKSNVAYGGSSEHESDVGTGEDTDGSDGEQDSDDDDTYIQKLKTTADALNREFFASKPLSALPARLKLPTELEHRIIDCEADTWPYLWLDLRIVCKSWRDYIESVARRHWMLTAYIFYKIGFEYTDDGKMLLDTRFSFHRIEDDGTAVFEDKECHKRFRRLIGSRCAAVAFPDLTLDNRYIFNIPLRNFKVDRRNLRITVPWRDFICAIFAEHNAVGAEYDRHGAARQATAMQIALGVRRGTVEPEEGMRRLDCINDDSRDKAYITVRRRRFGEDVEEEERMEEARRELMWLRMLDLMEGGDDDEENDDGDGNQSVRITFSDDSEDEGQHSQHDDSSESDSEEGSDSEDDAEDEAIEEANTAT